MNSYDDRGQDCDYGWDTTEPVRAAKSGNRLDPAIIDEAKRLKVEEGLTHREIGARLKVSTSTIGNHVPKLGRPRCGIMTAERIAEVLQMRAQGMSLEAIGRQIGVSSSYVSRFVPRTKPWTRRGKAAA